MNQVDVYEVWTMDYETWARHMNYELWTTVRTTNYEARIMKHNQDPDQVSKKSMMTITIGSTTRNHNTTHEPRPQLFKRSRHYKHYTDYDYDWPTIIGK